MNAEIVQKVRGYIFRSRLQTQELLVFDEPDYPEAGFQVPGGTVDPGESPIEALKREMKEETGYDWGDDWQLISKEVIRHHRSREQQLEYRYRIDVDFKDRDSWTHLVTGGGEDDGIIFRYHWFPTAIAREKLWPWLR